CLDLSTMDDPSEWEGPFPAKIAAGSDGGKALMFDFGKGGGGNWLSKTFADRGIDLDTYDLLKFDYRVEDGGGYFSVRFRQWPFMGGFLALGNHIDPVFKPREWKTMTFNLHEPENSWEQSYDRHDRRMDINFDSVMADPGKTVRVCVDNIRLIRQRFAVVCDIDDLYLDFGERRDLKDGSSLYRYTLTLQNRTDRELSLALRLDSSKLKLFSAASEATTWRIPAKGSVEATITVTVPATAKSDKGLPPAYSEETLAHFTAEGDPTSEHTVTLLAAVPFKTKPHPYLFATGDQIREAKKRMNRWGWAKNASAEYLKRAEFAKAIPPGLPKFEIRPEQPGDKICPVCKDKGKTREIVETNPYRNESQYRYQCETCGKMLSPKLWRGDVIYPHSDSGYWWKPGSTNVAQAHAISFARAGNILDLAIDWQLTGDKASLQRVADVVREYIQTLPTYPFCGDPGVAYTRFNSKGNFRVSDYFGQTEWLHRMTCALDLIWDAGILSDAEKRELLAQLTDILYQRLRIWSPGYSNHRTTAAGLGIALLSDNAPLLAYVLNDPLSGVHAFFRDSMTEDGFNFAAAQYMEPGMGAWMPIFNTLQMCGFDLVSRYPSLRRFGIALQQWLDPDGLSPDMGDSDAFPSLRRQDWYELCYAWTGDPRTIVPVQRNFYRAWQDSRGRIKWEDIGRPRETLFHGAENIPRGNPDLPTESVLFSDYGLLIFNQGEGDRRLWAAMPIGEPLGHGFNDNLHIEWWALGQKMTIKQGSRARVHAVHENTLIVDQKDQAKLPCEVSGFIGKGPVQGAVVSSRDAYPGTTLTRTIMLYDGLIFLLDYFESDREHDYDTLYLNAGTAHCELPFKPLGRPLSEEKDANGAPVGYGSLLDPEQAVAPAQLQVLWDNLGIATNAAVRQTQIALDDPGVMLRARMPLVKQHGQWERMTGDIDAAGYTLLPEERQLLPGDRYVEWLAPKYFRRFHARKTGVLTILEPFEGKTPRLKSIERLPLTVDGRPAEQGIAIRYTDENGVAHQAILCPGSGEKQAGGWTVRGDFTAGPNGPLLVGRPVP
ncbi:MAG: hypothetical protein PHR35_17720, partial [Kiritimatiellae bacterium]|nr:hypothetical protein [Kiritimatiellia bacterium]